MSEGLALVADIGRQCVRFGLTGGDAGLAPRDVRRFSTSEHPTFTSALVSYLGDLINLTGSRWYISLSGVEAVLRAPPRALNECAANALALTMLPRTAFTALHGPPPRPVEPGGNYVVIGTGTGLGVAALVTADNRLVPVQSEAGHIAFAPETPDERKFADYCHAKGHPLDVETLISAHGLCLAYEALSGESKMTTPEEVTRNTARDPVATSVVRMFIDHLGSFAGDLALAFGAWDGIYLTGAISRALQPQLMDPGFRRRMEAKAAFRRQLSDVPVALVNRNDLELLGAAAAFGNA